MDKTFEQVKNHLEFLGYTVNVIEPKDDNKLWGATAMHSSRNNLLVLELLPNLFYFTATLTTERKPSPEADKFINELNSKLDMCRVYYVVENELMVLKFEAILCGEYNKQAFSKFYELMEADHKKLTLLEGFDKVFLKQ